MPKPITLMALNFCPNCGANLTGQTDQTDQADMHPDLPVDAAPDLPPENTGPLIDQTLEQAQMFLEHVQSDNNSPLVGQLTGVRSMVQELLDAMDKGESLDLPYYRQTAFELKRELDRLMPLATVARFRYGGD